MSRRLIKQLIYGIFFFVISSLFFALGYLLFIKPAPTCTDSIKNQKEEEVDCGGPLCVPCAIKNLRPLVVLPLQLFDAGENRTTVFAQIQNLNSAYGGSVVPYVINFYNQSGKLIFAHADETAVYADSIKAAVIPTLAVPFRNIMRSELVIGKIIWSDSQIFTQPKLELRGITTRVDNDQLIISGMVQNMEASMLKRVDIGAVAVDAKGLFINASKTTFDGMVAFSEIPFKIFMPVTAGEKISIDLKRTKVFVDGRK